MSKLHCNRVFYTICQPLQATVQLIFYFLLSLVGTTEASTSRSSQPPALLTSLGLATQSQTNLKFERRRSSNNFFIAMLAPICHTVTPANQNPFLNAIVSDCCQ